MCETGHSAEQEGLRQSLRRLEQALAEHEPRLAEAPQDGAGLAALRHSIALLREERDRLRMLLED